MSVRVVARIRPLLKTEIERDCIVKASGDDSKPNIVKIPNPKNEGEDFSFQFNGVYDRDAGQQELFDGEGMLSVILFTGQCSAGDNADGIWQSRQR